jgi:anti-anti-sigma factor
MSLHPHDAVEAQVADGRVIARLNINQLDDANTPGIGACLRELLGVPNATELVVDLTAVASVTSSAVAKLVGLHKQAKAAGRKLILLDVQAPVFDVLDVTRLTSLMDVRRKP